MAVNQQLKSDVNFLKRSLNLNQADIAGKLNVSPQYLSDMINGRIGYSQEMQRRLKLLKDISQDDIEKLNQVKAKYDKLLDGLNVEKIDLNNMPPVTRKLYLFIKEKTDGNISKFAETIGASQQVISRVLRRDTRSGKYPQLSSNLINKITSVYNLGDNYFSPLNNLEPYEQPKPQKVDNGGIPYFEDVNFGCSPSGFAGAIESSRASSFLLVPGLTNDGDTFIVPARGDSMINTSNPERSIPNGSLVAIRKSKLSTPRWGEVYALSTDDGCIIKRLYPSEREGYVKCVSFNEKEFPPFELHGSEIHDVGNVVAVVNVSMWL